MAKFILSMAGVVMGLPLELLFANIFMISLEGNILPKLELYLCYDIFPYTLSEKINLIIHELNSNPSNIIFYKFPYELKLDKRIYSIDLLKLVIKHSAVMAAVVFVLLLILSLKKLMSYLFWFHF